MRLDNDVGAVSCRLYNLLTLTQPLFENSNISNFFIFLNLYDIDRIV